MTIYLVCLVTKEVDLPEALVLDMSQAIGLVPPGGEDIKRYLSPDGVGEVVVGELLPEDFHEGSTDTMDLREQIRHRIFCDNRYANLVVGFELVTFRNPRTRLAEVLTVLWEAEPYVAFRPMGLTLIIPLRNSTKVPLVTANEHPNLKDSAEIPYRLIGMSKSAM